MSELITELSKERLIGRRKTDAEKERDDGNKEAASVKPCSNKKKDISEAELMATQKNEFENDSADAPIEVKKSRKSAGSANGGNSRVKKFRTAWLSNDLFKDWLEPHEDPALALCSVCCRVIKAGKSELEKHAGAKRHIKMMKDVSQTREIEDKESIAVEVVLSTGCSRVDKVSLPRIQPIMPHEATTVTTTKATVLKLAPHWKATAVVNGNVTRLELNDYGGRFLVLVFYPQDFAKSCALEVCRLSDRVEEFRAINAEVIACSTDSHLSHLAWLKKSRDDQGAASLRIALLADPTQSICKDYGVYIPEKGHTLRAHFIIDTRGIIRHASIYDPLIGGGVDEMLRRIQAIQRADEIDDYVPVDWHRQ